MAIVSCLQKLALKATQVNKIKSATAMTEEITMCFQCKFIAGLLQGLIAALIWCGWRSGRAN